MQVYIKSKCVTSLHNLRHICNLYPYKEQILEINTLIEDFHKDNYSYFDVKNKYHRIHQLKNLKHDILLKL